MFVVIVLVVVIVVVVVMLVAQGCGPQKKICFLEVGSQYLCSIEPRKVRSIQTGENKAKQRDRSRERVRDQKYIFQIKKIKTRIAKNLQK